MSEDRLEKALEAMKNESVTAEELAGARARVWEKVALAAAACGEFRPKLGEYLEGRLPQSRLLLMEDHLGRCAECRRELAALKGERKVVAMPPHAVWWPRWRTWALAAAMVLAALYLGRARIDSLLAPGGPRATVETVSGVLYRLPEGVLQAGAAVGEGEVVRTGTGSRAVLRLADGSALEVNQQSELFVRAAWSGQTIHLQRGDVIVKAAKQRRGRLRVETRDSVASVKGTVFVVSTGMAGSLVSVLEGSVEVSQPGGQRLLTPGEQAASNPAVATMSVREAVAWSPEAEEYLALLGDLAKLEKQIAAIPQPALRTQPRLLQYLPAETVVYGAAPNLTGTIQQALALAEQQAAESDAFRQWWNSSAGKELKELVVRVQSVTPLLGDEIVYVIARSAPDGIPMLLAEVQPGQRGALTNTLNALATADVPIPYFVTDALVIVSDSPEHLQWLLSHLGQGASSAFAAAIAQRYQRGVGWLLGMDMAPAVAGLGPAGQFQFLGVEQMKHLFIEQRAAQGGDENEVTLTFQGARTGLASWLASAGAGGAAEYVSSDALAAFSASTRDPRQLFDEVLAQLSKMDPHFASGVNEVEAKLGISFADDIVSALGTDFAISLERLSALAPGWVAVVQVNAPTALDGAIRKLVDACNKENPASSLTLVQETVDGRVWNTLKSASSPIGVTWTYDRGYLVAASDRGPAISAIATRAGGAPLIWSSAFQQQLPASTGLHPSGFAWLNTKGALQGLAALVPSPALQKLASERDPILVVLKGETEQIHAASRTRLSSLILDLMMFGGAQGAGVRGASTAANNTTTHGASTARARPGAGRVTARH
jgi:hypothetical protein